MSKVNLASLLPTIVDLDGRVGVQGPDESSNRERDQDVSRISECIAGQIKTLISLHGRMDMVRHPHCAC